MFVVSKRNIMLPGPGGQKFHMPNGYMGAVPAWAEKSAYLKALISDGKVIVSAQDKKVQNKKAQGKKAQNEEAQDKEEQNEETQEEEVQGEP